MKEKLFLLSLSLSVSLGFVLHAQPENLSNYLRDEVMETLDREGYLQNLSSKQHHVLENALQKEINTQLVDAGVALHLADNADYLSKETLDKAKEKLGNVWSLIKEKTKASAKKIAEGFGGKKTARLIKAAPAVAIGNALPADHARCVDNKNKIVEAKYEFIPLRELSSGQPFISKKIIQDISVDLRPPFGFLVDSTGVRFCFDNGKSPFPAALEVVEAPPGLLKKPFKYILSDSHHTIGGKLTALKDAGLNREQLDALTLGVKVDTSYKKFSKDEFWKKVKENNLLFGDKGGMLSGQAILDVPNDDMRDFLENTVIGCSEKSAVSYKNKTNPPLALWLRIGGESAKKSINFVELFMRDALLSQGFSYETGKAITKDLVDKAFKALSDNSQFLKDKNVLLIKQKPEGNFVLDPKMPGQETIVEQYCVEQINAPPSTKK